MSTRERGHNVNAIKELLYLIAKYLLLHGMNAGPSGESRELTKKQAKPRLISVS
jgi:hypothetical protein